MKDWVRRRWPVAAIVSLVLFLTLSLWLAGVISSAAALTAYATVSLAVGTAGLAAGAAGTYVEQRRVNITQQLQIQAGRENDIAQISVQRLSGPGQLLKVGITNNSNRSIRRVYVWADIDGIPGRYHGVVLEKNEQTDQERISRRMRVFRIRQDGKELYRSYRAILPDQSMIFVQDTGMDECREPVLDVDDAWITAYALFADFEGTWWKCNEEGDVERMPEAPRQFQEPTPFFERGVPGLEGRKVQWPSIHFEERPAEHDRDYQ